MHEFKLTIDIPGLPEAINNLAEALRAHTVCNQNSAKYQHIDHANTPVENTAPTTQKNPIAPGVSTAQNPSAMSTDATTNVPAVQSPSERKSYTLDDISKAGVALIDHGKMMQLCDLLERYGVHAITQLPAECYPAFVADLKALGARL